MLFKYPCAGLRFRDSTQHWVLCGTVCRSGSRQGRARAWTSGSATTTTRWEPPPLLWLPKDCRKGCRARHMQTQPGPASTTCVGLPGSNLTSRICSSLSPKIKTCWWVRWSPGTSGTSTATALAASSLRAGSRIALCSLRCVHAAVVQRQALLAGHAANVHVHLFWVCTSHLRHLDGALAVAVTTAPGAARA